MIKNYKHKIYSPSNPREKIIVNEVGYYLRGKGNSTAAMEMERLQNDLQDLVDNEGWN